MRAQTLEDQLQKDAQPNIERLTQRLHALEQQQQSSPMAATGRLDSSQSMVDELSRARALDVSRWEQDKRTQRRLETLKNKCDSQVEELNKLRTQLEQCKNTISRMERERASLQSKLARQTAAQSATVAAAEPAHAGDSEDLQAKCQHLQVGFCLLHFFA